MKNLRNLAVSMLVALICAAVFGFVFTSCENGIDGEPTFTASVKTEKIEVPVEVRDTVWQKEYITIHDTITMRDTTIIKDVDSIYVEVIKKEGIKANGEPGLEKIDDKAYLTWYPLLEDGEPIEPATELNVRAEMQDCDHNIIVVKSPIIGAPAFYAQKSTRQYQDGDFTKMEFKAAWTYNFGTFSETINTVHEKAWYYGWEMLSSYWTGGLKEIRYGQGSAYTYNGVEGTLYENTLVWEFTYNEDDVRTFERTHNFFVPAEGENITVTGIKLLDFGLEFRSNTSSYAYADFYSLLSDNTEKLLGQDGVEVYNSIEAPATQDVESTDFNVVDAQPVAGSKVFVSSREVACKFGGKFLISKYRTLYTTKTNKASVVFTAYHEEVAYVPEKGNKVSDSAWEKEYSFVDNGSSSLVDLGRENGKDGKMYKSQISATYNGHATDATAQVNLWVASPNRYGIASGSQSHTWDYGNTHHIATIFTYNIYENGQLVGGGLKGYIDGKEVVKKEWSEVTIPAGSILGLGQKANGEWVLCRTYQYGDAFMWRSIENGESFTTSIPMNQVRIVNNGKAELYIASTYTENADGSVTVSSSFGSATAAAW